MINLRLPENPVLKPCITVFGVGGAGGNAVNNMISSSLEGVKFVVANTDAQALEYSLAERRIQLGETITRGLGAGASPDIGRAAAEEAMDVILEHLQGSNMVFITAGMGGGTGTGSAPVVARAARENGILTVGVVTKPFHFEGAHRMKMAELGLAELQRYVDTLIVIPNQNLFRIANEKTTFADAFKMADEVLHAGVRGITDLMIMPGLINLDFADIRAVMSEMGKAMMGTGEATGDKRALQAAEAAIANPLLDNCSMKGARGVLINITGGADMTLFEVDEAANRIRDEVDADANIIFGSTFNQNMEGRIRVSVVATGIDLKDHKAQAEESNNNKYYLLRNSVEPEQRGADVMKKPEPTSMTSGREQLPHSVTQSLSKILPTQAANRTAEPEKPEFEEQLLQAVASAEDEISAQEKSHPSANINIKKEEYAAKYNNYSTQPQPSRMVGDRVVDSSKGRSNLSLFGRMANSVGWRTQDETAEYQDEKYTSAKDDITISDDEMFEVPAFLRRKK